MIGIFDSGIGGATIFKEILKELPNYNYYYYSDSKNNPYGNKSKNELYKIVKNIVNDLIDKGCKIIIIACNTASMTCVKKLREEFKDIHFIATEPAYKVVHDNNFSYNTIIMATTATTESERFKFLYDTYNNNKTSILPCPGLADLIERDDKKEIEIYLRKKFKNFKNIKNVVLGCTHYPLIKKEISSILGDVKFFDSAYGVTKQLKKKIEELDIKEEKQKIYFYDSNNSKEKENRFYKIIEKEKV